ncbi:MAG: hypothetical protein ACYCOU_16060 [Sulfobacillus sp.]
MGLTRRHDRRVNPEEDASGEPAPGMSLFEALRQKQKTEAQGLHFAQGSDKA